MTKYTNFRGFDESPIIESSSWSVPNDVILDDDIASSIDSMQDYQGSSIVTDLIKSSPVYSQAYSIFSNDRSYGSPYLMQLEAIPYAHSIRDENFWDNVVNFFGGTSGFDTAVQDAYNVAMDEIRSLISQYYAFRNSLPSEQVQQMAEAGVNAALTGEGITTSAMGTEGIVSDKMPSQSQYTNDQLSQGVSSFVSFIDSIAQLTSVGFSSVNLMGLLDIAERDQLNKQELHDLLLAQLGIKPSSSRTVLDTDNVVVGDILARGANDARIAAATSTSEAAVLNKIFEVPNLKSPDPSGSIRLSGLDVLTQISEFAMVSRLGESFTQLNQSIRNAQYSDILSILDREAAVAGAGADIAQGEFNADYYNARTGSIEGANQSTLTTRLSELKRLEIAQRQFDEMLSNYRQQTLNSWGKQIHDQPHLAPFFYKALFDFGMDDTFYHQSRIGQGIKYGVQNLSAISTIVGNIIGSAKPAKVTASLSGGSNTTGPKGETVAEFFSPNVN